MIEDFIPGQEEALSPMIQKIFDEFIGGEYSREGKETFRRFIDSSALRERFEGGNIILVARKEERIIGIIEIRDMSHVCLFFVDSDFHGRGIGRQLMDEAVKRISGKSSFLTVRSSTYALPAYEKLGFTRTGEEQRQDGILSIPMKRLFP